MIPKNNQTTQNAEGQTRVFACSDLSQDVLLPHQFLPLSVGVGSDHRQDVLAVVWHHAHKEHEILQELRHKPGRQTEALNTISVSSVLKTNQGSPEFAAPSLILDDVAKLKLPHSRLQDLAGVVGKVQVSDL